MAKPLGEWIGISICGLLTTLSQSYLLYKELEKRDPNKTSVISKYHQYWCILCIISGMLYGFCTFIRFFPILCHIGGDRVFVTFGALQGIFIGIFQLSRLYYCFSRSKVHSKKGYPTWLFKIMYSIAIILLLVNIPYPWFFMEPNMKCGINAQGQYYVRDSTFTGLGVYGMIALVQDMVYLVWDIITFSLYIIKRIQFRNWQKRNNAFQWDRVKNTLNRIIILTILYELAVIANITVAAMYQVIEHDFTAINITSWAVWGLRYHSTENVSRKSKICKLHHYSKGF